MKKDNSFLMALMAVLVLALMVFLIIKTEDYRKGESQIPDYVDVQLIAVDGEARSGIALDGVSDIVIHYVGNPGTSAQNNRDWFNQPETHVASHFIVGLEGEIVQCIPLNEKSSASNHRNRDTISIEVCHPDESGKFNDESYAALVKLTAWLCRTYGLTENNVIRHYDVTGKECPLYFVKNNDAWMQFKADVKENI